MVSRKQWGAMFAKQSRGEVPEGTAEKMAHNTKTPFSKLPVYSHSAAAKRRRRERQKRQ